MLTSLTTLLYSFELEKIDIYELPPYVLIYYICYMEKKK